MNVFFVLMFLPRSTWRSIYISYGKPGLIIKVHNIIILQIKVGGGCGRGSHLRAIRRPRIHSHIIITHTPQYMIILQININIVAALSKLSWPKCNHAILSVNFRRRVECSVGHTLLVQRMCHNANLALKQNPLQHSIAALRVLLLKCQVSTGFGG